MLATMGGQGQPQILAQVLLRTMSGASPEAAVAAPRAIVGLQIDGGTEDSVTLESDAPESVVAAIKRSGFAPRTVPPHTEALGQTSVVVAEKDGAMRAASDPRSDGAAVVAHFPRIVKARD